MVKTKKLISILTIFLSLNFFISSQEVINNESELKLTDNLILNEDTDSSIIDDYFSETSDNDKEFNTPSTAGTIFKMIIFLILIIAAIYGLMWFFKRKSNLSKSDDDFLRRVSSLSLAPGKSVEIVTLLDHAYILGVTDNNINILGQVDDKELIEALNLNFDKKQTVKKPMNFSDVLDIFMPNGPREKKNIFADTENKIKNLSKNKKDES